MYTFDNILNLEIFHLVEVVLAADITASLIAIAEAALLFKAGKAKIVTASFLLSRWNLVADQHGISTPSLA